MPGTLTKIWSAIARQGRTIHHVEASHVDCPYLGRVAVDQCLACSRLRDVKLDGESQWVACASGAVAEPQFVYRPLD